jgi:hypothetical protein
MSQEKIELWVIGGDLYKGTKDEAMRFSEEELLEVRKVLPKDCDSIEDYEAALKEADEIDV